MAAGDILEMRVHGICQTQNIVNLHHFEVTAYNGAKKNQAQDLVDAWFANLRDVWLEAHSEDYKLMGVRADAGKVDDPPLVPGYTASDLAGTIEEATYSSAICRVITLYADEAQPTHRNRLMLSGTPSQALAAATGNVTAVHLNLLEQWCLDYFIEFQGIDGEYKQCCFSVNTKTKYDLLASKPRSTPALIRSRRPREYSVG